MKPFNSKVASSEKIILKRKLGTSSVFFIMSSQNSIWRSKSSLFNFCNRLILYEWNLIFFKILCTAMRLMSYCWFALRVLMGIFDKWLCNIQLFFFTNRWYRPGIFRFFTLPVSLKRWPFAPRWISKWLFSSRKVSLKICLTLLYDLWRSLHPRIMRKNILSRSKR